MFDDKTEWNIRLEGKTDVERRVEAGALAHQHNRMMLGSFEDMAQLEECKIDDTWNLKLDWSPENSLIGVNAPLFEVYRDGKLTRTYKISGDPAP